MSTETTTAPEPVKKDVGYPTPEAAIASLAPLHEKIATVADKTPRTVLKAVLPEPLFIAGKAVPPITMRTWLYLEKIESPFVHGVKDSSEISTHDVLATIYVICAPADEVGAAIRSGPDHLAEVVEKYAGEIPIAELPVLTTKLADHFAAEFSPRTDMVRDEEGSGTGPKAPASSATGSAVGSPSSIAS